MIVSKAPVSCHTGGPREQTWLERWSHYPGEDFQDFPVNPTGRKRIVMAKMPQHSPALPTGIRDVTSHQEPPQCRAGRSERGRDRLTWGRQKLQPSSGWSRAGGGCSETPLCKLNHHILHISAAAPMAFYPHNTKRKENKKPQEGQISSCETRL